MKDTILFDLDGTLLAMDTGVFTKEYFKELSVKLKDFFTPEEVARYLWKATERMVMSQNDQKTNEEVFYQSFYGNMEHERAELDPVLDEFYQEDFDKIKRVSEKDENMIQAVEELKAKGYQLVVATNPLFPRMAVLDRIRWAGLNKDDFKYITSFEKMHFCKPNLNFYRELLIDINRAPVNCIMVGNDVDEDMVAKEIGIQTYLVDEFLIGDKEGSENIDHSGSYKDFYNFAKELPNVEED